MKHLFRSAAALAATILLIPGCRMEFPEQSIIFPEEDFQVRFIAQDIRTRTIFGAPEAEGDYTVYPTLWTGLEDKIAVSLNLSEPQEAGVTPSETGKSAEFSATFPSSGQQAPFVFYALSPLSAYISVSEADGYLFGIPEVQTPSATSCDEAAMILAATQTADSPSEFSGIDMHFSHVTAYGKLTLKNLPIASGESVLSLTLSSDTPLTGKFSYDYQNCLPTGESAGTLTVDLDSLNIAGGIWFACAPADLGGSTLALEVLTTAGKYTRSVEIPLGGLSFTAGRISKFSVNMAEAVFESSDPILENEAYGAYLSGDEHICGPGSQISREYRGTVNFAIITPANLEIVLFGGIPANPSVKDTFTLNYNVISGGSSSASNYNVTVVKIDGSKVWLSAGEGNGFIVKI